MHKHMHACVLMHTYISTGKLKVCRDYRSEFIILSKMIPRFPRP